LSARAHTSEPGHAAHALPRLKGACRGPRDALSRRAARAPAAARARALSATTLSSTAVSRDAPWTRTGMRKRLPAGMPSVSSDRMAARSTVSLPRSSTAATAREAVLTRRLARGNRDKYGPTRGPTAVAPINSTRGSGGALGLRGAASGAARRGSGGDVEREARGLTGRLLRRFLRRAVLSLAAVLSAARALAARAHLSRRARALLLGARADSGPGSQVAPPEESKGWV